MDSDLDPLLRAVVNALPIVVYAIGADGTVQLSEGHALEGMSSAPGAAVGRRVQEVFEGEPEALDHIERALRGERHQAEITLRRNQRTYQLWYLPSLDAEQHVTGLTGLALDVTDRVQARRELRDAYYWLERLLEHMPVAVFAVAADGTLSLARGSILPEETQQRVGRPLHEAYAHYPELLRVIDNALEGQDGVFTMSDSVRDFEFLIGPMRDGPEVRGAIGVIIEVTEHLRAAAARAENEHKSRFLAAMSHELRTPLNSVLGFTQLLQQSDFGPLNERQRRYLSHIQSSGAHLLELINDVLDLSKVQTGRLTLAVEAVDAAIAVAEVVTRLEPIALARGVRLVCGRQASTKVSADRVRLAQILLNLAGNAVKFTPPDGQVEISSGERGGEVVFSVRDTGVGIARDQQGRVFDEFYRVPGSSEEGTGLGLALSRQLARAMGGDITLRSRLGAGSTFQVRLPAYSPQK